MHLKLVHLNSVQEQNNLSFSCEFLFLISASVMWAGAKNYPGANRNSCNTVLKKNSNWNPALT